MPVSEPGRPDPSGAEAEYVAARRAQDYTGAVRRLLGMPVWLPVKGSAKHYLVAHRGDQRLVRAYTSPSRVTAVAGPDVDPAEAVRHGFANLVRAWRHPEIGLVINPDSDSELQIPRRLFDRVLAILPDGTGGPAAAPEPRTTPPRLIPIDPPNRLDGFRFATLVDSVDESGAPRLAPERGTVESRAERRRIREYLDAGVPVQLVPGFTVDLFDPARGQVVPMGDRTDGEWIWAYGAGYYLQTHGIAPEPDFYRAIVAAGYTCPSVPDDRVLAAGRALEERQRIAGRLYQEWRRQQG